MGSLDDEFAAFQAELGSLAEAPAPAEQGGPAPSGPEEARSGSSLKRAAKGPPSTSGAGALDEDEDAA